LAELALSERDLARVRAARRELPLFSCPRLLAVAHEDFFNSIGPDRTYRTNHARSP
jgi:hypothetical protein